VFFSLEMSADEITERLLAAHGQIDTRRLRSGDLSDSDW